MPGRRPRHVFHGCARAQGREAVEWVIGSLDAELEGLAAAASERA